MSTKGIYNLSSLSCLSLGDCSLFELPLLADEQKQDEKPKNKTDKNGKKVCKKVSIVLAFSVIITLLVLV